MNLTKNKRKKFKKYVNRDLKKEVQHFLFCTGIDVDISNHKLKKISPTQYELNSCSPSFQIDLLEADNGEIKSYISQLPDEKNNAEGKNPSENLIDKISKRSKFHTKKNIIGYIERKMVSINNARENERLYQKLVFNALQDFTIRFGHKFTIEDVKQILNS